jgi:hypothetical protein
MTPYFVILFAFALWAVYGDFSVEFTWFIVGAATGAFLRQVGYLFSVSRRSALLLEIVDWQRVDELLAEPVT